MSIRPYLPDISALLAKSTPNFVQKVYRAKRHKPNLCVHFITFYLSSIEFQLSLMGLEAGSGRASKRCSLSSHLGQRQRRRRRCRAGQIQAI